MIDRDLLTGLAVCPSEPKNETANLGSCWEREDLGKTGQEDSLEEVMQELDLGGMNRIG